jgi:hypothetical protein
VDLLRYSLGGRRGLIVLTVATLGAGAYFNWDWLVAAGIAPLLLALAPCIAMCALGLCRGDARPDCPILDGIEDDEGIRPTSVSPVEPQPRSHSHKEKT